MERQAGQPRAHVESLPIPLVVLAADGIIADVNRAARELLDAGLQPGGRWGEYLARCGVPPAVVERLHEPATRIPLRLLDAKGRSWPCEACAFRPEPESGLHILLWETQSRSARQRRTQAVRQLDAVHNATLHMANSFNNSLAAITGVLEGIQRSPANAADDALDALYVARQAAMVVRDLQRIVRPTPPRLGVVDPAVVVHESVSAVRRDLPPHVRLVTAVDEERTMLTADRQQLVDAVIHLLSNARDAIPDHGTIRLRVSTPEDLTDALPPELSGRPFGVIEVQDDGTGIPPADLPRIYEPFFSTRHRPGLGLASVYQTLKQHEGGITVESRVGGGSTFRLFVPVATQAIGQAPPETPAIAAATPARVLVIDDDPAVRRVVRKTLERERMLVHEAASGEDGLDRFRRETPRYDIVILDIIMPGLSGWEVIDQLRKDQQQVPVILQSGFMTEVDHDAARYAAAFLRKPYELSDLVTAVKTALTHRR